MPILGIVAAAGGFTKFGDFYQIATSTASTGSVADFTFSNIPQDYTHLQIRGIVLNSDGNFQTQFNTDTAGNYSRHYLEGGGASAATGGTANSTYALIGSGNSSTTNPSCFILDILDYTNANKYKTTRSITGGDSNGSGYVGIYSSNWRSTSAITSIKVYPGGSTWGQYSSVALYGIKAS
jgi:hypothetical protein